MEKAVEEAIEKHYERLIIKEKTLYQSGKIREETAKEQLNRLSDESHKLERNGAYESFVYSLYTYTERVKDEKPPTPSDEIFETALDKFQKERGKSAIIGEEVKEWCSQPIENIINDLAQYLAYKKAIDTLRKIVFYDYPVVSDVKALADIDNTYQYLSTINSEKSFPEQKKKRETKKAGSENELLLKWTGSDPQLIKLYNELKPIKTISDNEYYSKNYIDCQDYKLFEKHFHGNKCTKKIIWIKSLGELIYLMDNLNELINNAAYPKDKDTAKSSIILSHFEIKNSQNKNNSITDASIHRARNKFLKGRDSNPTTIKKIKNITIIIQEVSK